MTRGDLTTDCLALAVDPFGRSLAAAANPSLVQAERLRLITLGLMAFFASLAAQPSRLSHGRKTDGLGSSSHMVLVRRFDRQGAQLTLIHPAQALPEILRLGGIAVRRRQCKAVSGTDASASDDHHSPAPSELGPHRYRTVFQGDR